MRLRKNSFASQWILLGIAFAVLAGVIGRDLYAGHQATMALERERLATQARVVDDNLSRQLAATHLVLDSIRRDLPALARQPDGQQAVTRRLHAMREAMPGIRALTVFDAAGTLTARSPDQFVGQNFSQRDYYRIARQGGDTGTLYVAPPFLAATGEYVLNVVKVLTDRQGNFSGIVLASLSPDYFKTLLESVRYAPDMWEGIAHSDGKVFLITPSSPGSEGGDLGQQGRFFTFHRDSGLKATVSTGEADPAGMKSIIAMRTVTPDNVPMDKPPVLIVARRIDNVLAPWRDDLFQQGGLLALLLVITAAALHLHQQRQRAYDGLLARRDAERRQAETDLRVAAAAFESQEGMMVTDAREIILKVNRALTESSGYRADEMVGQTPRLLKSGRHDTAFYRAMWDSIAQTGGWQGEIWDRKKNGEVYPKWLTISAVKDSSGTVTHYISAQFDITERKRAEERIRELAFYDQLTGLPNRTLLLDRLRHAMAAGGRAASYGALLLIDLDNFKQLNDTRGHDIGDVLLKQVAQRLTQCIRDEDTIARPGGDEFVVVLSTLSSDQHAAAKSAEKVAEKVLAVLEQPFRVGDIPHACTASIGVTLFLGQAVAVDELMKQADLTMYKAKAAGRNAMRFFDPAMEAAVIRRAVLETSLRNAVHQQQFELHYQAQVIDDGIVVGAEALVRWRHPERGMVPPGEFIPLAEETGQILPLGAWVLETACAQIARWVTDPRLSALTVAVNVSAHQFRQANFVEQVLNTIQASGANPKRLKLELTESVLVDNVTDITEKMFALKARGVGFSMDDFGTGYSSLSYLKRLPLEQLKIDRSFVNDVLVDANDATIARTIIALAQSLGLGVIAEGVETAAQRDFLAAAGCHAYQGYFFSRPLPLADFEAFVRAN